MAWSARVKFIVFASLILVVHVAGCTRHSTRGKNTSGIPETVSQLPEPDLRGRGTPTPLPIASNGRGATGSAAFPQVADVQPPRSETLAGVVPPFPGMPERNPTPPGEKAATPIAPTIVTETPHAQDLILATGGSQNVRPTMPDEIRKEDHPTVSAAATGDAPVRRLVENLKERREEKKDLPKLPSPFESKEPPLAPPMPPMPPMPPVGSSGVISKAPSPLRTNTKVIPSDRPPGSVAATRVLLDAAVRKYAGVPDYECRLVRKEVVNGKQLPTEELVYLFRKEPLSVYMRVTGDSGKGREVLYVKGQNNGKMVIITGEGDNRFIGAGRKVEFDPDDKTVTAKSRNRIYDAGMNRPLSALTTFVEAAEKGTRPADTVKHLGSVERAEYRTPLNAVEVTLLPGDEPLLPKGGKRTYFFDTDPQSDANGLPVMIITLDTANQQVEYYCFDRFRMPAKLSDVDFSVERLGKRK